MSVDLDALLKEPETFRKTIQAVVHNALKARKSGKNKSVKNEDEKDEVIVDDDEAFDDVSLDIDDRVFHKTELF